MAVEAKTCRAREVALASFEGALNRDPDQIVALAHPEDYMDDIVAIGEFRGKDAVRDFFRELFAAMPDFDLAVEHVVADESTGHRRGPHGDQDHRAERPVQHQQSERGVAAGDEHEDHRVIKPAHAAARAQRSPVNAVIKRAGAEQCGDTQRIDPHREERARTSPRVPGWHPWPATLRTPIDEAPRALLWQGHHHAAWRAPAKRGETVVCRPLVGGGSLTEYPTMSGLPECQGESPVLN